MTAGSVPVWVDARMGAAMLEQCCNAVQGTEGAAWGEMASATCAFAVALAGALDFEKMKTACV